MAIEVTVTNAESFDGITENDFYDITFTNTNEFDYAANSNIYYFAHLTDSTPTTPKTWDVTFTVAEVSQGTIAADTHQTFTIENTEALVAPVTGSAARILYVAQ